MMNTAKRPSSKWLNPKFSLMKKIIAILAVVTGIGFITPSESSARDYCHHDRRIVSYHSCGAPVYAVYHVHGRDRYGRPVGHWVTQNVSHSSCGSCYPRSRSHHGHHHHSHRPTLPVPPHHRAAASFFFGFGR